jgi:nucleotide-binding universal stress UspA family protein
MKRLLIATDGSEASRVAVTEGVALARELDARILFVYVKPAPSNLLGAPYYQRRLTSETAEARRAVGEAIQVALENGVDADWEILGGDAAGKMVSLARERDADLIVVGSHGRGAIAGSVIGSVSREVVHDADRPVLIARPHAVVPV